MLAWREFPPKLEVVVKVVGSSSGSGRGGGRGRLADISDIHGEPRMMIFHRTRRDEKPKSHPTSHLN